MQIYNLSHDNSNYPDQLRNISSPPASLYCIGTLPNTPMVSIIGSRRPTGYGKQVTYQLAGDLAKAGLTIVSGLATGIDTIAHEAAVDAGGLAVAVLAHGLDRIYPTSNRGLAMRILSIGGALISEYDEGMVPFKGNFVARNRIIAGLSLATIVTEAGARSGSLITAKFAATQTRTVMAVPGNITSPLSAGPNNLLRSSIAAIPVTSAVDVLEALNLNDIHSTPVRADSREEAHILELMRGGHASADALIEHSKLSAAEFANIITLMEITGKVRNLGAGQWVCR